MIARFLRTTKTQTELGNVSSSSTKVQKVVCLGFHRKGYTDSIVRTYLRVVNVC